jgi:hypothetical protein
MIYVIAVILTGIRLYGITHIAFQAAAHLYVGGLIAAWYNNRKSKHLYLAIALSVLEVAAFLYFRVLNVR